MIVIVIIIKSLVSKASDVNYSVYLYGTVCRLIDDVGNNMCDHLYRIFKVSPVTLAWLPA
jgi:hypothetical protein